MNTTMSLKETTREVMLRHNELVKDDYKVYNTTEFIEWLVNEDSYEEGYVEISSNETLSGHPETLEFDLN